jgi:hypothetical protein
MARRDKRRARDLDDVTSDDAAPAEEESSLIVPPAPPEPPAEPAPATKVTPITREPGVTLSVFARSHRGPIMKAFMQCERLQSTHTRKLTRTQWAAEFDAFVNKPR